jgi:hypothetical protein
MIPESILSGGIQVYPFCSRLFSNARPCLTCSTPLTVFVPEIEMEAVEIAHVACSVKAAEALEVNQYDVSVLGVDQVFRPI